MNTKNFEIAGPWTLFKYPSDGTEHKSPAAQQQDQVRKLLEQGSREQKEAMSELVDMKAQMLGNSYEDTEKGLLAAVSELTKDISSDQQKLTKAYDYIVKERNTVKQQFDQWRIDKNWKEICSFLMENEKAKIEAAKQDNYFWQNRAFNWTHERFIQKFGREPQQTQEDLEWLIKQVIEYRDVAFYQALDQAIKNYPEVEKAQRLDAKNFQKAVDNNHEIAIKKYGDKKATDANYVEFLRRYIVIYFQRTRGTKYANFK